MTPIASVVPVDEVMKAMAPGGVASKPAPPAPEMVQKFEALMHRVPDGASAPTAPGHNVISNVIERQQSDIERVESDSQKFLEAAPTMGSSEVVAASMAISHNIAMMGLKLQVATSITQGSNKSLQTLLKNQ